MRTLIFWILLLLLPDTEAKATEAGQSVPQCAAILTNNAEKLDLSAYKGRVILIDFWATWCPPCKQSMPFLNNLRNRHVRDGFEIIAINVDENSDEAKHFLQENPVDYTMAFDSSGDCPSAFAVKAMPSSYLVDKSGTIRMVHLGFRNEDQPMIIEQVTRLLAE